MKKLNKIKKVKLFIGDYVIKYLVNLDKIPDLIELWINYLFHISLKENLIKKKEKILKINL